MTQDFFTSDIIFMGFYDSVHSYAIDSYYECMDDCQDTHYTESEEYQNIDFYETYKKYSDKLFDSVFLPALNDAINELLISKKEYDFAKHIKFHNLRCPKEYNFHNDKIEILFSKKLMNFVWNKIDKKDFNDWLIRHHYSYSGFISFFSGGLKNEKWSFSVDNWKDYQDSVIIEYLLRGIDRDAEFEADICVDSCLVFKKEA